MSKTYILHVEHEGKTSATRRHLPVDALKRGLDEIFLAIRQRVAEDEFTGAASVKITIKQEPE